jgi:hypothetical protein
VRAGEIGCGGMEVLWVYRLGVPRGKFRFGFGISPDLEILRSLLLTEEEEEESHLGILHVCMYALLLVSFCTLPTAPVSRSFGLRYYYESISLSHRLRSLTVKKVASDKSKTLFDTAGHFVVILQSDHVGGFVLLATGRWCHQ